MSAAVLTARALLSNLTPLKSDCGRLCGGACCQGDDATGMLLFPGEEALYTACSFARVLPAGVAFPTAAIGRIIAVKRRCGLGTKIVTASIEAVRDKLGADMITIEAQVYARSLYENLGFRQTSEEFLEDGIPHIQMQLEL